MKKKLFLSLLVTSLSLSALTVSAAESSSEPDSLTFEALSRYTFEFSSGAGAWSTYFTIERMALSPETTTIPIWAIRETAMATALFTTAIFPVILLI